MEEPPLFKVVACCEYDGWQQPIEEEPLIKVKVVEFVLVYEVHHEAHEPPYDDSNARLMEEVDLDERGSTLQR